MAYALLIDLVLRAREAGGGSSAAGLRLLGAHGIELDEKGRRRSSFRVALPELPTEGDVVSFPDEAALLSDLAGRLARSDTLVTLQGRQVDLPVLESLALRHRVPLPGEFSAEDPYRARRSPYNLAGHLDLLSFLADGDRRMRWLDPGLVLPALLPGAFGVPARDLERDDLVAARRRALATYLLYLRVQRLRGLLSGEDVRARLAELSGAGLPAELRPWTETPAWAGEPYVPPATRLANGESSAAGLLAFDIETVPDEVALGRALGRRLSPAEVPAVLAEVLGGEGDFAPAPFHRVVAVSMVRWERDREVELERLVLGGASGAGAPTPTEADLLAAFWQAARGRRLASYNGRRFDLPVLLWRSLPHPIELPFYLAERGAPRERYRHPHSVRQLDVFERLAGGLSPGPLGDLLEAVGLPGKLGPDGGDVARLWAEGEAETVGDYCLQDAAQTLLLALRFLEIAGELSPASVRKATGSAYRRFSREPALAPVLEGGVAFLDREEVDLARNTGREGGR